MPERFQASHHEVIAPMDMGSGSLNGDYSSRYRNMPSQKTDCAVAREKIHIQSEQLQLQYVLYLQLTNSDHTKNVLRKILIKFNVEANPEDFIMFQVWSEGGLLTFSFY